MVACYDAEEGGYFRPHRDNETLGAAHRKFACSINLNAGYLADPAAQAMARTAPQR